VSINAATKALGVGAGKAADLQHHMTVSSRIVQEARSSKIVVKKLQYDLFQFKHMSWLLDFVIVLETVKTVLRKKGLLRESRKAQ
jgi:lipopolysaccharide/colanic/teichoic acid biosynthesis glycosyltransferase